MLLDDVIYLTLLFISVASGSFVRSVPDVKKRQLYTTVIGLVIAFIVSGFHILHPLILTFVNAFIVLAVDKRICHIVSFVFCFTYLVFFRLTEYFGLPAPPTHTNAIQMVLTLKMVGLAYEVNMYHLLKANTEKTKTAKEIYTKIEPSFFDIVQYSFCFAGVLIGPYYKYRTYWDVLHAPYSPYVPVKKFLKERISVVPLYMGLFLLGNYIFPLEFASSEEILQEPFWYRVFYMSPQFFNFRMRIYAGFVLGECVCISMGLGAYPTESNPQPGAGPTNYIAMEKMERETKDWRKVQYSFETVKNITEYGSEFWTTIREGIRSWNRTVQYWLATFVYMKTSGSKPVKILLTMLVSAFWHGVHPGYYLCLLSAPLFLLVEREVEKAFWKNAPHIQRVIFSWVWWVIKMQSFSYMGMAFLLLDIRAILHYWSSIYFIGHIFILVVYAIALYKNKSKSTKSA